MQEEAQDFLSASFRAAGVKEEMAIQRYISAEKKKIKKERTETQSGACCRCLKHRWDLNSNNPQKLSSSGHQLTSWLIPVRINAWNYYAWQMFAEWELVKNTQDEDHQEVKAQTNTSELRF